MILRVADGLDEIRLGGEDFCREAVGQDHLLDRLLRLPIFAGRGRFVERLRECGSGAEEQSERGEGAVMHTASPRKGSGHYKDDSGKARRNCGEGKGGYS